MSPRGTTRAPGADPTRLPLGLDLRAISVAEGVRAGFAAALPVAASVWLHDPGLSVAALGALLTCICDPGGPWLRRLPLMLAFILAGAGILGGMGLVRGFGIAATLAVALPCLFCAGYLRVWGAPAQAVGNLLAVVLLLGTDERLDMAGAVRVATVFAAGGAWALLLGFGVWRIHPYGPARRAVADVWHALSSYTRMLQRLLESEARGGVTAEAWESHARGGRGAVRAAIERARSTLMGAVDARGPASGPAAQNFLRLEAADQLFGVLIALADHLEGGSAAARMAAIPMLRRLRPLLLVLGTATERERMRDPPRFERAVAGFRRDALACPEIGLLARAAAERLLMAIRTVDPAQYLPGSGAQGDAGVPWRQRISMPAAANWTFASASLRHAVRVACVVTLALGGTLLHHGPYTHWLTITLVLVMQPFFATTWQRTLERVGGTLLGGAVAAGLSAVLHSRLHLAGLLPVMGALALAVRQVSYGVYIAVYTPVVILLVEQIRPHESQVDIAVARAGYTVLGGLIAVAANAVLWPAWQPEQVGRDLLATVSAHAAFAQAVFSGDADPGRARRQAGLASNNLEASLQRAMHEPRRGQRDRLQAVLVADATLRRIAGRLAALSLAHDAFKSAPALSPTRPPEYPTALGDRVGERAGADLSPSHHAPATPAQLADSGAVCGWAVQALHALADGQVPPARPSGCGVEQLERLARQVELLAATPARTG